MEGYEARFKSLAEEGAFGALGPGDEGFGERDLCRDSVGEGVEEVEKVAD